MKYLPAFLVVLSLLASCGGPGTATRPIPWPPPEEVKESERMNF
jgi:hypothetical protein